MHTQYAYSNRIDMRHIKCLRQFYRENGSAPIHMRKATIPLFIAEALLTRGLLHVHNSRIAITPHGIRAIARCRFNQHAKAIAPDINSAIAYNAASAH